MYSYLFSGKISWAIFFVILIIRPLANITNSNFFKKAILTRKWLGILCGLTAILHALLFLAKYQLWGNYWFNSAFWNFSQLYAWGNLALIFLFFPFITSNQISQKILCRRWCFVQKLSYPAFILTGIHIYLVKHDWQLGLLPVFIWAILWIWAEIKIKNKQKNSKCSTRC